MEPLGGPYWSTGRAGAGCGCGCCLGCACDAEFCCCCCFSDCCGCCWGGSLDALTANMVASTMCGSMVMVTVPTLVMLSFGGFLGSSWRTPLRLYGLVQYFSNRPSLIHFWRERESDSARTPLLAGKSVAVLLAGRYAHGTTRLPLRDGLIFLGRQVAGLRMLHRRQRLSDLDRRG